MAGWGREGVRWDERVLVRPYLAGCEQLVPRTGVMA